MNIQFYYFVNSKEDGNIKDFKNLFEAILINREKGIYNIIIT